MFLFTFYFSVFINDKMYKLQKIEKSNYKYLIKFNWKNDISILIMSLLKSISLKKLCFDVKKKNKRMLLLIAKIEIPLN